MQKFHKLVMEDSMHPQDRDTSMSLALQLALAARPPPSRNVE